MNKFAAILLVLIIAAGPVLFGQSKTGNATGTVNSVTTVAKEKVKVLMSRQGVSIDTFEPFPVSGTWTFTWDGENVDFTGTLDFGDYQTLTIVDGPGGTTKQLFYGFAYHVSGTASWDETNNTLSYEVKPEVRNDGRASTVSQSKAPECVRVSGVFTEEACKDFEKTSLELEGLKLEFVFNEDKSSFTGQADLIQYSGKGETDSETTSVVQLAGDLADK